MKLFNKAKGFGILKKLLNGFASTRRSGLPARQHGFTLAEVLITLAIIGVVSAMTIPTLINNYQKKATAIKLEKFYTNMAQAIKLSEVDNGPSNTWDYGTHQSDTATLKWFNTYIAPYLRYSVEKSSKVAADNDSIQVSLPDGTIAKFWIPSTNMHIFAYLNGEKSQIDGKDTFIFFLKSTEQNNAFTPYDYDADPAKSGQREYWTSDPNYGCNKTSANKAHCAGLIMHDGWQIKDDYPWN